MVLEPERRNYAQMKIYIASHKHCELPLDETYQPLFVGAYKVPRSQRLRNWSYDDTYQRNISYLNPFFCELTGLHWIWKCSNERIKGLVHYRRFLGHGPIGTQHDIKLDSTHIEELLTSYDCLVARHEAIVLNNQSASMAYHYRFLHSSNDLQQARMAIKKVAPDYLSSFDSTMLETSLCPCNILIARSGVFDSYAQWLFSIMKELSKHIDPVNYRDIYQQRVFGFLAERLMNVYLRHNHLKIMECNLINEHGECIGDSSPTLPLHDELPHTNPCQPIVDGCDYSSVFDRNFYLRHYRDVADYYHDNPDGSIHHFLAIGIYEGHVAHPRFSISSYINGQPALRERLGDNPMGFIRWFISHPRYKSHALGFENLNVSADEILKDEHGNGLNAVKRIQFALACRAAERCPLID